VGGGGDIVTTFSAVLGIWSLSNNSRYRHVKFMVKVSAHMVGGGGERKKGVTLSLRALNFSRTERNLHIAGFRVAR